MTLRNPHGLHIRLATEFVRQVLHFESVITIKAKGKDYQADRIIDVVLAELNCGDTFTLHAEGPDSVVALDRLVAFLSSLQEREESWRRIQRRQVRAMD